MASRSKRSRQQGLERKTTHPSNPGHLSKSHLHARSPSSQNVHRISKSHRHRSASQSDSHNRAPLSSAGVPAGIRRRIFPPQAKIKAGRQNRNANESRSESKIAKGHVSPLFNLSVFRFSLLENGHVGVRIFPQRHKILISSPRLPRIALQRISPPQAQMRQRTQGKIPDQITMVNNFLELRRGLGPFPHLQVSLPSNINRKQFSAHADCRRLTTILIGGRRFQNLYCLSAILAIDSRSRQCNRHPVEIHQRGLGESLLQIRCNLFGLVRLSSHAIDDSSKYLT